jgi:hypothetical protein
MSTDFKNHYARSFIPKKDLEKVWTTWTGIIFLPSDEHRNWQGGVLMQVRINKRTGIPRLRKKPENEPDILMAKLSKTHSEIFKHTCGTKLDLTGYNGASVVRCPGCGNRIPITLPACKHCGARCADIPTLIIHERFCNGDYLPKDPPPARQAYNEGGYHLAICKRCGKRFKENASGICKSCVRYEQTSERMKKFWLDPRFRERATSGMRHAFHKGGQKAAAEPTIIDAEGAA